MQRSPSQSSSGTVNFQLAHFQPLISEVILRFHSSWQRKALYCMFAPILHVNPDVLCTQTFSSRSSFWCICFGWHANQTIPTGSHSPSLPAPGCRDGERPSRGHNASCSHSEKPHCCSFPITHEPCVWITPFTATCLRVR